MSACSSCGASLRLVHARCPACGAEEEVAPLPRRDGEIGRSLPGGYVLLDLLAIGATGRVYAAEQQTLARTVSVKLVPAALVGDERRASRLLAELRHASRLEHPNAVRVLDMGTAGQGDVYVVMELLRGRSLRRMLRKEPAMSAPRIATLFGCVLEALSEAHHLGIAHGHLGAGSVLTETTRGGEDIVKVVGFGQGALHPAARGDIAADPIADVDAVGVLLAEILPEEATTEAGRLLAEIARKSSSPDPRERYVTARALADALNEITAEHPRVTMMPRMAEAPVTHDPPMQCPTCGAIVPGLRFCGGCGLRLPVRSLLPAAPVRSPLPLPMVARDEDLAWLSDRRAEVRSTLTGARLVGEPGAGKTRLLRELVARAKEGGDRVIELGPDPSDAEVAYFALRRAILSLAFEDATAVRAGHWEEASPDAKRALEEIVHGLSSRDDVRSPDERRHAAAEALRWALLRAGKSDPSRKLLLVIEDLDRVDWPSRAALADAIGESIPVPGLFLATHVPGFDPGWPADNPARVLGGIPLEDVARLLPALPEGERFRARTDAGGKGVVPLYVEHVLRYRLEGGWDPPARLGDLLARRVERLESVDRATLQALAVLGDDADARSTTALLPTLSDLSARLDRLEDAGMIVRVDDRFRVAHSMLREITLAHIPASVRRDLHEKARRLFDSPDVPVEVRALHADEAGHAPAALRLLGQVAERARTRGDLGSAAGALRRAWRLARRSAQVSAESPSARTALGLAIELSLTLLKTGGFSEAERVLADMAAFVVWKDPEKAKLRHTVAVSHVARGRMPEARKACAEAIVAAEAAQMIEMLVVLEALRSKLEALTRGPRATIAISPS